MNRWGKPIKNRKHSDPRYFLNENIELDEAELEEPPAQEETGDQERCAQLRQDRLNDAELRLESAIERFILDTYETDEASAASLMSGLRQRYKDVLKNMSREVALQVKAPGNTQKMAREIGKPDQLQDCKTR